MKPNTPCLGCKVREPPECHITCQRYIAFRAQKDAEIKQRELVRKATDFQIWQREHSASRIKKYKDRDRM